MSKKDDNDKLSVGRHQGEHIWGYEVLRDGSIKLAPCVTEQMQALMDRERGIKALDLSVLEFVRGEFVSIIAGQRKWWAEVLSDLGVPDEARVHWVYQNGIIANDPPTKETGK